ncbi:PQQ-binding-like beta-propeller repeat protein [Streptomyces sp. NPDC026673]|uniref:serine/threonine-protein kinase n=1 Tax=Streptomyces sp. NPDC026673 TaxID=3155724 RepID=UPI0033C592A0
MPPLRRPGTGPEAEHPEYAGQYRLERRLGSGGMGVVHLSRSTSGMRLAVKVVHEELAEDPEFRARFRQEVTAARRVSGAFTAPVVDADPDADRPWMATLYIPGPTLAEFVKRNGPVSPAQVRYLMAGLAEALRDIHRAGVVHRDLKPSNVLLAADGPKVIDFGISRPSDSNLRTETGKLIGTPPFMAPEQFRRPREVGPAADVFAMASVLVHSATGRSPFESDSPYIVAYQVVHDEPQLEGTAADLRPIIERCLAKEPEDRPTPDELMAELRSVSASYDTQTFAAFDTGDAPAERLIPTQRQPTGHEAVSVARASGSGDDAGSPPSRGRLSRKAPRRAGVVALALAVLGTGTLLATRLHMDHSGTSGHHGARDPREVSASSAFHSWSTVLRSDDGPAMAACAYAERALFCTGPGVRAAKVDPDSGLLQWSVRAGRISSVGVTPTPPMLSEGTLQVVDTDQSRLEGLDPVTGKTKWTRDISANDGAFYGTRATVLLVGHGGTVTAVDGRTGTERWRSKLPGHVQPSFAAYDGAEVAYAVETSSDGRHTLVTAVDQADGTVRKQARFDGQLSPIGSSGTALFLTSSDAFTRTDGIVRLRLADWSIRRIPLTKPLEQPQALVSGETVYLLAQGGALLAIDTHRADGAAVPQLWRIETSVNDGSRPTVVGDRLYFTAADGRLLAVDARRGDFLGQTRSRLGQRPDTAPTSPPSPVVADGKVFATAPDGSVFAVDAKDPSRW